MRNDKQTRIQFMLSIYDKPKLKFSKGSKNYITVLLNLILNSTNIKPNSLLSEARRNELLQILDTFKHYSWLNLSTVNADVYRIIRTIRDPETLSIFEYHKSNPIISAEKQKS